MSTDGDIVVSWNDMKTQKRERHAQETVNRYTQLHFLQRSSVKFVWGQIMRPKGFDLNL